VTQKVPNDGKSFFSLRHTFPGAEGISEKPLNAKKIVEFTEKKEESFQILEM
jgi:hypothetical protein